MPRFQLHDTVVLRDSPTFVGLVERTSHVESEPLEDCLIIAHTHVETALLAKFISTGTPPSGYVFVQFASQEKGSSLVSEDDLFLIDRMLELGDVVKSENAALSGTVINVTTSYVLDPVWQPQPGHSDDGQGSFGAIPTDRSTVQDNSCGAECHILHPHIKHVCPPRLIPDVPFEELKRAQDFMEGDYVTQQDWLGLINEVKLLVIVRLSNGAIVAVQDPEALLIPIPDHEKPLVLLPEFDDIPRPAVVSAVQGHSNVIPPEDLESGQFVITSSGNLQRGRALRGSWDDRVKPEGVVLLVRCSTVGVCWLMCNAYTPASYWSHSTPPKEINPYENINAFPNPTELRRNKALNLYDPGRHSPNLQDRTRAADPSRSTVKPDLQVNVSSSFNIGDQVKFRDPAGAAVTYQGTIAHGVEHGKFNRIPHATTAGYDLNEFEVVQTQLTATVRWQDGTISEHRSTSLTKINLFEADYMPGDIVVARHGMKQQPVDPDHLYPDQTPNDFNEMTYFEKPHDLLPAKVGIIQNVLTSDKLAQVRWYTNPNIRITRYGNAISTTSRFGPISAMTEDVSLYEVMTFPALVRKLRDIVTIAPSRPSQNAIRIIAELREEDIRDAGAHITALSQFPDRSPTSVLEWMQHVAKANQDQQTLAPIDNDQYKPHRSLDWAGEICQLRTDGQLVVRLNTYDAAQDVLLEHDQLLAFVDAHPIWGFDHTDDPMDMGSLTDISESEEEPEQPIHEVVEYEGGLRLDDDPGDDNWESEDDVQMGDQTQQPPANQPQPNTPQRFIVPPQATSHANTALQAETTPSSISSYMPTTEPPSFACLESAPPSDQFRLEDAAKPSSAFLKRIAKEHRILSTSLPYREIYVRTYESRLDLLRCLIIGPVNTPYEHAPFLIDLHLGPNFPKEPPTAHFHSWTSGMGRINPNLYEEGKICLSLLGTWPGKSETEGWTPKATILQLLVSLQGLVFVKDPFYNEAGFEGYEVTKEYTNESFLYSEKAYVMSRNFVKHALNRPVMAIEDVLAWLYLPDELTWKVKKRPNLLMNIIARSSTLMRASDEIKGPSQQLGGEDADDDDRLLSGDGRTGNPTKVFLRPLSRGAFVMLNKSLMALREIADRSSKELADRVVIDLT